MEVVFVLESKVVMRGKSFTCAYGRVDKVQGTSVGATFRCTPMSDVANNHQRNSKYVGITIVNNGIQNNISRNW